MATESSRGAEMGARTVPNGRLTIAVRTLPRLVSRMRAATFSLGYRQMGTELGVVLGSSTDIPSLSESGVLVPDQEPLADVPAAQ